MKAIISRAGPSVRGRENVQGKGTWEARSIFPRIDIGTSIRLIPPTADQRGAVHPEPSTIILVALAEAAAPATLTIIHGSHDVLVVELSDGRTAHFSPTECYDIDPGFDRDHGSNWTLRHFVA